MFALVVLVHAGAALVLWDYLARKHRIVPPEPIVVTLIEADQPPADAAESQPAQQATPAPRAQPLIPPRPAPLPVPPQAVAEPLVQPEPPAPPPPQPRPEPVAELPPPPAPVPESVAPAPPAPAAPVAPSEPAHSAAVVAPPSAPTVPPGPQPATGTVPAAASPAGPAGPPTPPRHDAAYLDNPKPAYPLSARQRRLEGTVRLRVFVNATGTVDEVHLHQTSGSPALDRSALDAVKQWRFVPARKGERAVPAWVIVPIVFTLKG
jgi:protein TonB